MVVLFTLVLAFSGLPTPPWWLIAAMCLAFGALLVVQPPAGRAVPVWLEAPVRGRWVAINSPGSRVPSHGTRAHGQWCAVDITHPSSPDSPAPVTAGLLPDRPTSYPSFGAPVHAMESGEVVYVSDWQRDHRARNTWPVLMYMMVIEATVRSLGGFRFIGGNHVTVAHADGTAAVYAHLKKDSARVRKGAQVVAGDILAAVGNTGNSSEPHLHVQLMDRRNPAEAVGIPMLWRGLQVEDELDPVWGRHAKAPEASAIEGFPRNAEIFTASGRGPDPSPVIDAAHLSQPDRGQDDRDDSR